MEAEDFIGESPLYKKAVVTTAMDNVADSVANVLTGWNQGPHNYMEDLLDLPRRVISQVKRTRPTSFEAGLTVFGYSRVRITASNTKTRTIL